MMIENDTITRDWSIDEFMINDTAFRFFLEQALSYIPFKDYDFIEIGTSNFDTMIEKADELTVGLTVEPLKFYLDDLPSKSNVRKLQVAVTNNTLLDSSIDIYYIPPNVIHQYNLPWYLKGCNRVNEMHPLHISQNLQQYVQKETVPLMSICELLTSNHVRRLNVLKIDTEGHDDVILHGLFDHLHGLPSMYYPSIIRFECNENTPSERATQIKERLIREGYTIVFDNKMDVEAHRI